MANVVGDVLSAKNLLADAIRKMPSMEPVADAANSTAKEASADPPTPTKGIELETAAVSVTSRRRGERCAAAVPVAVTVVRRSAATSEPLVAQQEFLRSAEQRQNAEDLAESELHI